MLWHEIDPGGRVLNAGRGRYGWFPWPTYEEWLKLAGQAEDQDFVWRLHELLARMKNEHVGMSYARGPDDPCEIDLGGEA